MCGCTFLTEIHMDQGEVKPDGEFEKFLTDKIRDLPEGRKGTITRLARSSFYGATIFERLYPKDATSPPDTTCPDRAKAMRFARPAYRSEDIRDAARLWREFADEHPARFQYYREVILREDGANV